MNSIEDNLKAQGIIIPDAPSPAANYVPCIISNNLAIIVFPLITVEFIITFCY